MQETRKPQKEEKRSLEKKDTENMEMKKPEEQAKPKKKKIISVVRPQNATSKEAKEFTKNQGQKKDRPSRGNGRPEGNRNGNGRSEDRPNRGNGNGGNGDRPNRNGDRPQGERRFNNNGDRPNRNGDRPQGERRFNNNGDRPNRSGDRPRENAASAETMETARTAAETVREEIAITAEEAETVREAEDHSVSVPHVQTEADREIMAEDRSQERMMIPRIRTAVREETAAEPSIRALQAIQ